MNGYALNHVTISTHRLKSRLRNIKSLNQFIEENGFKLNSEGGNLKGNNLRFYVALSFHYRKRLRRRKRNKSGQENTGR